MNRIFVVVVVVGLWLLGWVLYYYGEKKEGLFAFSE